MLYLPFKKNKKDQKEARFGPFFFKKEPDVKKLHHASCAYLTPISRVLTLKEELLIEVQSTAACPITMRSKYDLYEKTYNIYDQTTISMRKL